MSFTTSAACRSRAHCGQCRMRTSGGAAFRRSTGLGEDFDCPHGVPWEAKSAPRPAGAVGITKEEAIARAGPPLWRELHTARDADPAWIGRFTARLPCGECKEGWRLILRAMPPVFDEGWFEWTVAAHNAVNAKLHKPLMPIDDARRLYPT